MRTWHAARSTRCFVSRRNRAVISRVVVVRRAPIMEAVSSVARMDHHGWMTMTMTRIQIRRRIKRRAMAVHTRTRKRTTNHPILILVAVVVVRRIATPVPIAKAAR